MLQRTIYCGSINQDPVDQTVILNGWVQRRRDLGGLIFIDLRDREGHVQVIFNADEMADKMPVAEKLRSEYVIAVKGLVKEREEATKNPNMATGDYEVIAQDLEIINTAKTPPLYIEDDTETDEEIRLNYRYLDLRRPKMLANLKLRHQVTHTVRNFLDDLGFLDVETPMLTRSTPEGARDYLVPTRRGAGKFYALPQSPQIFKQLLMGAGIEKYYQIVKCFRDEDLRGDRQPEFTQIDIETSFMTDEDIMGFVEEMLKKVAKETKGIEITEDFPKMTYDEAMANYGNDKPDIRFEMTLKDLSEFSQNTEFGVFKNTVANGGQVKGIALKGLAHEYTRRTADDLQAIVEPYGAKGLAWMKVEDGEFSGPIARFFNTAEDYAIITETMEAEAGDILFFVADQSEVVAASLAELRLHLGKKHALYNPEELAFLWVVDWPLYEYDEEDERYVAMHHPFTAPQNMDLSELEANPGDARAQAYDIVLNGYEIGGGSIRIFEKELQEKMFEVLGFTEKEARAQFGFLMDAFEYGFPPHGGIALGLDRLVMILAGEPNIREVIAFPKTGRGVDLLMDAPSDVDPSQLDELHLNIKKSKK